MRPAHTSTAFLVAGFFLVGGLALASDLSDPPPAGAGGHEGVQRPDRPQGGRTGRADRGRPWRPGGASYGWFQRSYPYHYETIPGGIERQILPEPPARWDRRAASGVSPWGYPNGERGPLLNVYTPPVWRYSGCDCGW